MIKILLAGVALVGTQTVVMAHPAPIIRTAQGPAAGVDHAVRGGHPGADQPPESRESGPATTKCSLLASFFHSTTSPRPSIPDPCSVRTSGTGASRVTPGGT